jgi:hypothetical protein
LQEETAERQRTAKEDARQAEAERVERVRVAKVDAIRAETIKGHAIKIVLPKGAVLEVYSSTGERIVGSEYSETTDGNINLVRGKYKAKVSLVDSAGSISSGSSWFTVPARNSVRVPFTEFVTATPRQQPVEYEQPVAASTTEDTEVYYQNCSAARAAGAAPILEGEPGYRSRLDRDRDGIACE